MGGGFWCFGFFLFVFLPLLNFVGFFIFRFVSPITRLPTARQTLSHTITFSLGSQSGEEAADGPPELLFMHAGHRDRVADFGWNYNDEWTIARFLLSLSFLRLCAF